MELSFELIPGIIGSFISKQLPRTISEPKLAATSGLLTKSTKLPDRTRAYPRIVLPSDFFLLIIVLAQILRLLVELQSVVFCWID